MPPPTARGPQRAWLPLAALLLAGLMFYGARASVGNFAEPWQAAFGDSRGDVSLVATAMFLSMGLFQAIAGRLAERIAAWRILLAGLVLGTCGFVVAAFAQTLAVTVLGCGVMVGAGSGLAANSTLAVLATQLFRERHGALFGVIGASTAAGTILLLPISRAARDSSTQTGLLVLAAGVGSAAIGVALFLRVDARRTAPTPVSMASVVGRRDFWLLGIPFFVCGITSTGITDPHLMPYMEGCGVASGTASAIASALAAFNVIGTLASGVLTDRVDPRYLLAGVYGTRGLALLCLPLLRDPALLAVFALAFGLADFSSVPPTNALAKSSFAHGGWATFLGLIGLGHQVGSAVGAKLGGVMFDRTGGYGSFFVLSAALCAVAAALSLGVGRPRHATARPLPAAA